MNPIGLVKHFHNLSRTIEFDLFGFLNLDILNFKVGSSTVLTEKFKFEFNCSLDNVESYDKSGLHVSDTVRRWKLIKS